MPATISRSNLLLLIFCCSASVASAANYKIESTTIGSLNCQKLTNIKTGECAMIITDYGGRVEELNLRSAKFGRLRNVLLTHNKNESAIIENKWWKGMILLPWANRIAKGRYTFFNGSYQLNINENTTNPTRLNSLHGLLAGKVFDIERTDADNYAAILGISYSFSGNEQGYPFKLTVYIEYTLDENGFKITFRVTNNMDTHPLPFYLGWHPYFACAAYKAFVTLDRCGKWSHVEMNDNFNPTGITDEFTGFDGMTPIGGTLDNPTFYDDEYKIITSPNDCPRIETRIYDPDVDETVVLWQDSNFRIVHIFTGSTSFFGENAIAIEPMSGMADAYNNHDHLSVVSGNEIWKGEFGVYVN